MSSFFPQPLAPSLIFLSTPTVIVAALAPIFLRRYYNKKHPALDSSAPPANADVEDSVSSVSSRRSSLSLAEEGVRSGSGNANENGRAPFTIGDEDEDEQEGGHRGDGRLVRV